MTARGGARDVRVEVAPGTLGVKFEADYNGNCAIVKRFIFLPSGQESPLKRHVPVGWAMVMCNDKDLSVMKYADVMSHMKKVGNHRRTLIFRESSSHYSKAQGGSQARRKNDSADLDVEVTQFRLNRESAKQFAEYEVICTLRRKPDVSTKAKLFQWGMWRRYSAFDSLKEALKKQYGWQVEEAVFPGKKTFGALDPTFLEQRRRGLDLWMHHVTQIKNVSEFHRSEHLSSMELKRFIEYDEGVEKCGLADILEKEKEGMGKAKAKQKEKVKKARRSSAPEKPSATALSGDDEETGAPKKVRSRKGRTAGRRRQKTVAERQAAAHGKVASKMTDLVISGPVTPAQESEVTARPPPAEPSLGPEYDAFKSMLKVGVPEGAVRAKMAIAGVDPEPLFSGSGAGHQPPPRGGPPPLPPAGGGRPPPGRPPPMPPGARGRPPPAGLPPPPLPPALSAPSGPPPRGVPNLAGRGGLLAGIRAGTMLKKTKTVVKGGGLDSTPKSDSDDEGAGGCGGGGGGGMMAEMMAKARARKAKAGQ